MDAKLYAAFVRLYLATLPLDALVTEQAKLNQRKAKKRSKA